MQKFKKIADLAKAIQEGQIPSDVVSPGAAAALLGITRQSLHDRLKKGTLEGWKAEGVVLVSVASLKALINRKKGIPETQGELLDVNV